MRTLGFRTHVLLALAAAAGLVATLGRPWYATAPGPDPEAPGIGDINGPLNGLVDGAQRWMTSPDGTTGWDALGHWGIALSAMAGVAALGALACMVPALQTLGRDLMRYAALAAVALAIWKLVDPPGDNAVQELRHGAIAAVCAAMVLLTCASAVASAPSRRRVAPQRFTAPAPPPPPAYGTSGSAPPPGT
jgi:hypothetical protein